MPRDSGNYIGVPVRDAAPRRLALAVAMLVFASPDIARAAVGRSVSYAIVTPLLAIAIVVITAIASADDGRRDTGPTASRHRLAAIVAVAAAAMIAFAVYRWTELAAWLPYHADMLIVLREATKRFLSGHNPYAVYRSYDAPWDMAMPYGPGLWGPFVVTQVLHLDFRLLTIVGQLVVPVWCGIAAAADASRGRAAAAASWLAVGGVLVFVLDIQRYTLIGHTPVYWPLFPLLALTIARRRWIAAAVLLGLLAVARTTMVVLVPIFLMSAFTRERSRVERIAAALAITVAVALLPFFLWDPRMFWDSMVLSYPRVMKAAVWPGLARPGLETIGVTEWLLEQQRASLIVPVQFVVMVVLYAAAWMAIRRGRPPLPWMALALFGFSMTTLYPVHYLYYDVFLLLICGGLAESIDLAVAPRLLRPWVLSAAAVAGLVFVVIVSVTSPLPRIDLGHLSRTDQLRSGFGAIEHDGARAFAWIVGREARIVVPRSSAAAADIVVAGESPLDPRDPPQRMAAILNGTLLGETTIPSGAQMIRVTVPDSAWWIGFNELRLVFSSTVVPRDGGASADPRSLALALFRVDVVRPKGR
jgi:hypothetical protein